MPPFDLAMKCAVAAAGVETSDVAVVAAAAVVKVDSVLMCC